MNKFDTEHFLRHYWQQKPVVLKGFFEHFDDPIDENDLAGLAQEDDVDSRVISFKNNEWQVNSGPIDDFNTVCQGAWTLLVQGVDRYIHEVDDIIEPFRFVPNWRLDDLMVSFATQHAGVGAHRDQYDVFLVQGKGQRRWRVGEPGEYQDVFPHPKLRQIEAFTPIIDEVLNPGDVLYIPPGWPHDGKALEDCLTYSVGFRAPDNAQLADSLTMMLEHSKANLRFVDPARSASATPARVDKTDIDKLKAQLIEAINTSDFTHALLETLSEQGLPEFPQDIQYDCASIAAAFDTGVVFSSMPGLRPIIGPDCVLQQQPEFYVNGERFSFEPADLEWVMLLIGQTEIDITMHDTPPTASFLETLTTLVNQGYWESVEVSAESDE